jgi:methenyltetrahydrofolate cyclohydrolase
MRRVSRAGRDEPGLGKHPLGRDVVEVGRRPEGVQPVLYRRDPAQLLHRCRSHAPAGDLLRDPVAELGCAVGNVDQVEPAKHRSVVCDEDVEDADTSFLFRQQVIETFGEVVEVLVTAVGDGSSEVAAVLQFERQDRGGVVGAQALQLGHRPTVPSWGAADADTVGSMRDQAIGTFLDNLAARQAAPGGGATAALSAAQAAALLAMVARYSDGPRFSEHAGPIAAVIAEADQIRNACLQLAADDAAAFGSVTAAYGLPRETAEQKQARSAAISAALADAAAPQAAVISVAARLAELIETMLPVGNRNVITDLAAGAEALRAAVGIARVNVEVNLAGVTDAAARSQYDEALAAADGLLERAAKVTDAVRADISW